MNSTGKSRVYLEIAFRLFKHYSLEIAVKIDNFKTFLSENWLSVLLRFLNLSKIFTYNQFKKKYKKKG